MSQKPIPLTNNQRSALDELAGGSAIAMNAVVDSLGSVSKRPGIQYASNITQSVINATSISAIHSTYAGDIYATGPSVGSHLIYKISAGGFTSLSINYASRILGTSKPIITETEALLVFAAGDEMQKVVLATDISSRLGGTPPKATHVIANHLRLIANDPLVDKSKLRYSDIATSTVYTGHEIWSFAGIGTSGYTSAEARPDPIVALAETADSIFAFGSTNVQIFVSDANLVFAPAATLEIGCSAPYSIIRVDNTFAWLDHHRRFVIASGNEFQVISNDISKDIASITTISDCYGYRVNIAPYSLLVWTFPTDGRTLVFQIGGGWSQWAGYDEVSTNWSRFIVNCFSHNSVTNQNIVGTTDGHIAELSTDSYTDLGGRIKTYVESGFVNRETDNRKHCRAVHVRIKKETNALVSPVFTLSYADYPGQWSEPIRVDLGYNSEIETVVTLRSLGVYRTRNWRFEFSEGSKFNLSGITEDYEVLGV